MLFELLLFIDLSLRQPHKERGYILRVAIEGKNLFTLVIFNESHVVFVKPHLVSQVLIDRVLGLLIQILPDLFDKHEALFWTNLVET